MNFEEVQDYVQNEESPQMGYTMDEPAIVTNAYDSLIHPAVVRKPTFSNFVHRLKQQSSKTRFVRDYKKMAASGSDGLASDDDFYLEEDNASIRVIDPTRSIARDTQSIESDDSGSAAADVVVNGLGIRQREKRPIKKVKINESANQIQGVKIGTESLMSFEIPRGDLTSVERFVTFDVAIGLINKEITDKTDEVYKQMKRIEINKDEITKYKQDLLNMQKQLDFFHYSLSALRSDHLSDMFTHEANALKNTDTLREHRNRNVVLKSRFDRYRKVISIDTRFFELEKKIKAAWRRDEIWAGIRDWGLLSVILLTLVIASFLAWQS